VLHHRLPRQAEIEIETQHDRATVGSVWPG
jgi:hypothetical protein